MKRMRELIDQLTEHKSAERSLVCKFFGMRHQKVPKDTFPLDVIHLQNFSDVEAACADQLNMSDVLPHEWQLLCGHEYSIRLNLLLGEFSVHIKLANNTTLFAFDPQHFVYQRKGFAVGAGIKWRQFEGERFDGDFGSARGLLGSCYFSTSPIITKVGCTYHLHDTFGRLFFAEDDRI